MNKDLILNEISRQNSHWDNVDNYFFTKNKYKRKLYFELLKYLDTDLILSIIGLRRTGKTVLLKQLAEHLIKEKKVSPKDVFFLSFDEAIPCSPDDLAEYFTYYLDTTRTAKNKTAYIFIDEIQYIDKWQHVLKRFYDTRPNIKFIVSGSSSIFLRKKTTESLAGRNFEFKLDVLDFNEYLEITGKDINFINSYNSAKIDIKRISIEAIKKNSKNIETFLAKNNNLLQKYFEEYLSFGHFPKVAIEQNKVIAEKYIRESIYKKTIEYDIPNIYRVDKVNELRFLYEILIQETGNAIELGKLASESEITYKTLHNYLEYLEESLLVDVVYNFSKSFRKSKQSLKKIYIASTNFYHLDPKLSPQIKGQITGHLAETYAYNLLKKNFAYVSVYKQRENEIDFIARDDLLNTDFYYYIEIKYKRGLRHENFKFLKRTTTKRKTKIPYLVFSKDTFNISDKGIIIPIYLIA
ncbi:MAG: ATP-binding protein [Patescibacteria group bacterium]|jgi:predicted AAA+ superfamily ATPase|nr:ATP-binding protein [Patescibacteria group bacterium]